MRINRGPHQRTLFATRRSYARQLWLLFAQTATVVLAIAFVAVVVNPSLVDGDGRLARHDGLGMELSFSRSIAAVGPSVVSIQSQAGGDLDLGEGVAETNLGSGVIVDDAGHIITNHHVVRSAERIHVITHEGERLAAELVGSDPDIDIAVLKVEAVRPLRAARLAEGPEAVKVGDLVMSLGSPYGLANTAALGIVSATGRTALGLSRYEHFIQTDAAINHGSSGGALANIAGEIVGINTALFSKQVQGNYAQGIGFAIPSELVLVAYRQIVEHGRFKRGWVGVDMRKPLALDLPAGLAGMDALVIETVSPDSPGERAGLLPGDMVLAIDGRPPSSISFMEQASGELLQPGEFIDLQIRRADEEFFVSLPVAER